MGGYFHIVAISGESLEDPSAIKNLRFYPIDGKGMGKVLVLRPAVLGEAGDAVGCRGHTKSKNSRRARGDDHGNFSPK